jgi:ketosteroid isomerase-like protein
VPPVGLEVVRLLYDGVAARLQPPRALFAPNFEADLHDVAPDVGVVHGFDQFQRNLQPYWKTFDGFHIQIEEVLHDDGTLVVTQVRDGGRMMGSPSEVWNRFFHVWTLADGEVVRFSVHTDRARALEVAGL